jgi:hypothetical protein
MGEETEWFYPAMDPHVILPIEKVLSDAQGRIGIDVGSRSVKACSMMGGVCAWRIAGTRSTFRKSVKKEKKGRSRNESIPTRKR